MVRNTTIFLQHVYGIIATSNFKTYETENDLSTTKRRDSAISKKWVPEEEHLLSKLKDTQMLECRSIFRYFPTRSEAAVRQRYSIIHSRKSGSPSSKETNPKSSRQPVESSSDIRRSHSLSRRSEIGEKAAELKDSQDTSRAQKKVPRTRQTQLSSIHDFANLEMRKDQALI